MGPRVTMSIWSSSYSLLCHDFRRKRHHWKEILRRYLKPAAPHFYDKKNRALALFEVPKRKSWKYAHHHILAFCGYLFRGEDVSIKFVISRYAHPAAAHSHIKISCFVVFRGQTYLGLSCEAAGHSIQLGWSSSKFWNDRQWYEIFCRRSAALLADKKIMLSCSFMCSSKPLCILRRQMAILFNLDETVPSFERTHDDTKFFDVQSPSCPINFWLTGNETKFFAVLSPCCPIKKTCFHVILLPKGITADSRYQLALLLNLDEASLICEYTHID